jgi:hypothetical protein
MSENASVQAPNSQTEPSAEDVPASQVAKGCLKVIEDYSRSSRNSSDKASATRDLVEALTSSTPELTESEFNDLLGTYLTMLEQHDHSIRVAEGNQDHETEENTFVGGKRGASPGAPDGTGKRQKQDDTDFPWVIRERLSNIQIEGSLGKTLGLLKIFARDLKFAKSSVINSSQAPPFPHSEWTNVVAGTMVDLDHVISGSFAVTNDNREVESLGGMEVKFGVAKPIKQVKTSGDWFIAWGIYSRAAVYVFPHRKEEFDVYGTRVLSLFAAASPHSHTAVINLDKGIRARVGECRNLLLTDQNAFEDLKLYWLNPIGAGGQTSAEGRPRAVKKPGYRDNEPCHKWNVGKCPKRASECRHKHVCANCGKDHQEGDCKSKRGSA